jgi:4,5-DOPA dioxygenase extradiol
MFPAIFIGHGSPMNAIEDNEFTREWKRIAASLPRPKAILSISAHWTTKGIQVTAMPDPRTIHDFYGFPEILFQQSYPAPGSPDLAEKIKSLITSDEVKPDRFTWGLDHGTWLCLKQMFPRADIPVVQLSLDLYKTPQQHYAVGRELQALRNEEVLIFCSGNIVHNLQMIKWTNSGIADEGYDWAVEFDSWIKNCLIENDADQILNYRKTGKDAERAVPSPEHFVPLFYFLGVKGEQENYRFYCEKLIGGSLSMRSIVIS